VLRCLLCGSVCTAHKDESAYDLQGGKRVSASPLRPRDWKRLAEGELCWGKRVAPAAPGGYLNNQLDRMYRLNLLSSKDITSFRLCNVSDRLISVLNNLQGRSYKMNKILLDFVVRNRRILVEKKLLADERYVSLDADEFVQAVRAELINKEGVRFSYSKLYRDISSTIQRANIERTIIELAKAYSDYEIYFPAFTDFRGAAGEARSASPGRIYRTGIINFHDRGRRPGKR